MEESIEGGGKGWLIFAAVIGALIVLALISVPLTANLVQVESERSAATQAQAQAQQAAERERTERERLANVTTQGNAQLRAESDARMQNVIGLVLVLVVGVFIINWFEGKQTQRTLLILEAQRQAAYAQLQASAPPYMQIERPLRSVNRLAREA